MAERTEDMIVWSTFGSIYHPEPTRSKSLIEKIECLPVSGRSESADSFIVR